LAPGLKQEQTFEVILLDLIHKSKKRNLPDKLPPACGGGQTDCSGDRGNSFPFLFGWYHTHADFRQNKKGNNSKFCCYRL